MDFSKLGAPQAAALQTDPVRIFEQLPNLPDTPNDLWRGQAEALARWHDERTRSDVLVSLNTGAGKTLVGLLVAQSLVNEGIQNVVYVCSTIDLVHQTSREATRVGIDHTIRVRGGYDNDLFESGRSFCITTYHALFNGLSSIRRVHFPGAVIFDDAHVAEAILRGCLTLSVSRRDHPQLFDEVAELFRPHFQELRIEGRFEDALSAEHPSIVMAAPGGLAERRDRLAAIFQNHGVADDNSLKFDFANIRDKLDCCALLFGRGSFELSPPFLPSLALDIFERPLRRVYLSATLKSKTDFVRAFGRLPDVIIDPDNDAGNGERLILFGRRVEGHITPEAVTELSAEHKVLVAVPNYQKADDWSELAVPPPVDQFSTELEQFRQAADGVFVLVSRVDGIDLPHDTCRVMVLDGLPGGSTLIERYQWEFLKMLNLHATRVANRLVQLFGRINRGRNDYGAFLIAGKDLNVWLNNDRNVALLPELLQRQVLLGRAVQEGMSISTPAAVRDAINAVINREPTWLEYYGDNIKRGELDARQLQRAEDAEDQMVEAALAEGAHAAAVWNGDLPEARNILDAAIEATARHDALLSGWQSVWLGAALEAEGDVESARMFYRRALDRLGNMIALPRGDRAPTRAGVAEVLSAFAGKIDALVGLTHNEQYENELKRIRQQLANLDGATPRQMEESTRALGELLGFTATRPDNDVGTGPDVLWLDEGTSSCIAFELKTDKDDPATYWKKDISQSHDHLAWLANEHPGVRCLGLLFVGPDGHVEEKGNPSELMSMCTPDRLRELRERIYGLIGDLRRVMPLERRLRTQELCDDGTWTIERLFEQAKGLSLLEMPQRKA